MATTCHWRCIKLQRIMRASLPRRLRLTDLEHEIRRMEADLEYHKTKSRIFEETLQEQQFHLKKFRESFEEDDSDESE